jgi:hypothetical protein
MESQEPPIVAADLGGSDRHPECPRTRHKGPGPDGSPEDRTMTEQRAYDETVEPAGALGPGGTLHRTIRYATGRNQGG